ncbi:MAG TPA: hypothetical protein PLX89_12090 [Verrucomicrobiota bacterium]|nr:hypothetical protein [Verrucomicrobiales bacterium]HRI13732.1 hypothetical protein [Verrucomicrobiota bacterium]
MSAVAVLTPVVIAAWPALSAAVLSAAAQLGFSVLDEATREQANSESADLRPRTIELEVPHSEVVTGTLGRDQRIRLEREGSIATFSRDARGRASVCVSGVGHTEEELRGIGEELSGRVVQQYVLQKLKSEFVGRGMNLVEETEDENRVIRLTVRHWQN